MPVQDEVVMYDTRNMTYAELVRTIPRRLYKYRPINQYALDGLQNHTLWFSSPGEFNDPFDCNVSCFIGRNRQDFEERLGAFLGDGLVSLLDKSPAGWRTKNKILMDIFRYFYSSRTHICCLSETCDNVLMWSHYADQHAGMCLVFNSHKAGLIRDNVVPVQYYKRYPSNLVDARKIDTLGSLVKQLLAAKSSAWSYEQEWRAFVVNDSKVDVDNVKGALYKYDPSLLSGVVFGINTSSSDIELVKSALAKGRFPQRVNLYQARAVKDDFTIDVRKIGHV